MSNPTRNSTAMIAVLAGALALSGAAAMAAPTTVVFEQLNGTSMPSSWAMGSQSGATLSISTDTSQNLKGSNGSLKASYPLPKTGSVYAWAAYSLSHLKTNEIYLDFWAKMPGSKQGLKFLKVFGGNTNGNTSTYANTTIGTDYTGTDYGSIYQVGFGDGTTAGNDYGNAINFTGSSPAWIGRSYGKATVLTPQKKGFSSADWGTGWHHFRVHIKFNSGTTAANEVNDGEYYVEIDGKVYVDAKGLFNRHYSNAPINRVEFFGWAQTGTAPFEIWYDDIRITTGGFIDSNEKAPAPPSQVVAQ